MRLFLLLLFTLILKSNTARTQQFFIGPNFVFQKTKIACTTDAEADGRLVFRNTFKPSFGIDFGVNINAEFKLVSGLNYSFQGQNYGTSGNDIARYKTELDYLKIPVLAEYTYARQSAFSFFAQAGFQLGILTKAKSSREQTFYYYSPLLLDVKSSYETINYDVVLAAGAEYSFKRSAIQIMLRFDYSLSDIERTEKKIEFRAPAGNLILGLPKIAYHYKL